MRDGASSLIICTGILKGALDKERIRPPASWFEVYLTAVRIRWVRMVVLTDGLTRVDGCFLPDLWHCSEAVTCIYVLALCRVAKKLSELFH